MHLYTMLLLIMAHICAFMVMALVVCRIGGTSYGLSIHVGANGIDDSRIPCNGNKKEFPVKIIGPCNGTIRRSK